MQVMLINSAKDVASALSHLINSAKNASGKQGSDQAMGVLKESAKASLFRRSLQKEMPTYRHWSVSLWRDPDDVSHC